MALPERTLCWVEGPPWDRTCTPVEAQVLDYDKIPIERSWAVSMLLHEELGHQGSWETCEDGCDQLGDRVIRALFDG